MSKGMFSYQPDPEKFVNVCIPVSKRKVSKPNWAVIDVRTWKGGGEHKQIRITSKFSSIRIQINTLFHTPNGIRTTESRVFSPTFSWPPMCWGYIRTGRMVICISCTTFEGLWKWARKLRPVGICSRKRTESMRFFSSAIDKPFFPSLYPIPSCHL